MEKLVVLIVDGAADWPLDSLGGKTPLEAANTPNLDRLAQQGIVGLVDNVPAGMEPSSAVACMSVLGFDPVQYYAGRGPIEALAMGINLGPKEVAMRCNLVSIINGVMRSYSAGGISTAEAKELVSALQESLGDSRVRFYPGVGFRHIVVIKDGEELLHTNFVAPHDITDRAVAQYLPQGPGAEFVIDLMQRSKKVLEHHPVNLSRVSRGELPATQIWLFWPGMRPLEMPSFEEMYGRKAALTSAVDLLRGLALQVQVKFLKIPGVTDGLDNDFGAQMRGALEALTDCDVVFVHVEASDEAAHAGNLSGKLWAIEQVDEQMVGTLLASGFSGGLLVLPDHPTPIAIKTHVSEPVPFLFWRPGISGNGASSYSEKEARATGLTVARGCELVGRIFRDKLLLG